MKTILQILEYLVPKTLELNRLHIPDEAVRINYAAIFCQTDAEYEKLNSEAMLAGDVIENTPTGPLYKFHQAVETPAGPLRLLKVRQPDPTRAQRGDADYTLKDYDSFKEKHSSDAGHFKIIDRGHFEMMELADQRFDVLSYFSNIPLTVQFGIE